jgi:uncharacterized membrane protein
MRISPILVFHICGGVLGVLTGALALFFRKGSRRHALAGSAFVMTMLCMSESGVYLSIVRSHTGDIMGGVLTLYLIATGWIAARRREMRTDRYDWAALLLVLTIFAVAVTFGLEAAASQTGLKYGYPPGPYIFLGLVALIAMVGDVRLLINGGISGAQRIARHLWRMCFGLFIASASIFLARQQIFPSILRRTGVLVLLSFLPLILMVFWLIRVTFTGNRWKQQASVARS